MTSNGFRRSKKNIVSQKLHFVLYVNFENKENIEMLTPMALSFPL